MSTNPESEATEGTATQTENPVEVKTPEFQNFSDSGVDSAKHQISRFADIKVTVAAELGRASVPIERLLTLGSGSVIELDRSIEAPVELVAQGIPLACGEVVVVNDCFAIRITKVYPRNRQGERLPGEQ